MDKKATSSPKADAAGLDGTADVDMTEKQIAAIAGIATSFGASAIRPFEPLRIRFGAKLAIPAADPEYRDPNKKEGPDERGPVSPFDAR